LNILFVGATTCEKSEVDYQIRMGLQHGMHELYMSNLDLFLFFNIFVALEKVSFLSLKSF